MIVPVYVGYDPREAVAYHTFCQSILSKSSVPCSFIPLHGPQLRFDGQQDGTNAFIYSRYLIPHLMNYQGWALFVDGDMVALEDIAELWKLRDDSKAVMVVKHQYKTKHPRKYMGSPLENDNVDYPRKNWSSVVLWNCGHPANKILTKHQVATMGGAYLHRFEWLTDAEIGELPPDWNVLVGEQVVTQDAKLLHYTLGIPAFRFYSRQDAKPWHREYLRASHCDGEIATGIARRAEEQTEWL